MDAVVPPEMRVVAHAVAEARFVANGNAGILPAIKRKRVTKTDRKKNKFGDGEKKNKIGFNPKIHLPTSVIILW